MLSTERSVIQFIKPCRDFEEDHRALTPGYTAEMLIQGRMVQINLDNCSLQRMEELPAEPTRAMAEKVGLLPLVEILQRAPALALSATGLSEMPDQHVAKARRAYQRFCATFWPGHHDDVEATQREYDESSTDRWVDFTSLSDGARCTYGVAYVALLQMQNIHRTYPLMRPEEKFETYLHSMVGMLDLVSAFELEIARYAFWEISAVEINRLPDKVRERRADIKANFTKLMSSVSKCKRAAFNGAMDLHWLSGSNLSEDLGATIKTNVGELVLDNWVGTNDEKLYRISRDLHSVPHEGSTMMRFKPAREPALEALPYWRTVDRLSKDVMLYRDASGYQPLDKTLLGKIDKAVEYVDGELHKALQS
ncbi:hypothetical protein [Stutzerimonas stutzeri]|uniref:hypothetical protein n=1 Tax=Stutzerimonas stutzeri TaxID=316 RepID=UPI00265AACB6|nr:hypothetical protein [Stutzerimonas stutzeri]MCF6783803.1 hypothetical protein [Stutzerimonas stutzeri]MCF6806637.1 hypothetical protein [Stutzerimonas stutzeri]